MNSQHGQRLSFSEAIQRVGRNQPHAYRIMVVGALDPDWSDRLGGLRIEPLYRHASDHPVTVLEGVVQDQAQLSGVLNTLCNLRLALLGVELIEDDTLQQGENS